MYNRVQCPHGTISDVFRLVWEVIIGDEYTGAPPGTSLGSFERAIAGPTPKPPQNATEQVRVRVEIVITSG